MLSFFSANVWMSGAAADVSERMRATEVRPRPLDPVVGLPDLLWGESSRFRREVQARQGPFRWTFGGMRGGGWTADTRFPGRLAAGADADRLLERGGGRKCAPQGRAVLSGQPDSKMDVDFRPPLGRLPAESVCHRRAAFGQQSDRGDAHRADVAPRAAIVGLRATTTLNMSGRRAGANGKIIDR